MKYKKPFYWVIATIYIVIIGSFIIIFHLGGLF